MPGAPVLEVDRVCVAAGGQVLLEDVSLSLRAGELVAVAGPSGIAARRSALSPPPPGAPSAPKLTISSAGGFRVAT